jgi:crossover junction endodeoxyribonuclease RuvC
MAYDPRCQFLAFDPGLNGAWAALGFSGEFLGCDELPRFDNSLDAKSISDLLHSWKPATIVIENVGAMPKQGVSSTFKFGVAYGICIGAAGGVGASLSFVTPGRWKRHFRLIGKPKDASRELAIHAYPEAASRLNLKKHCGRADALLMARFALDMDGGRTFA